MVRWRTGGRARAHGQLAAAAPPYPSPTRTPPSLPPPLPYSEHMGGLSIPGLATHAILEPLYRKHVLAAAAARPSPAAQAAAQAAGRGSQLFNPSTLRSLSASARSISDLRADFAACPSFLSTPADDVSLPTPTRLSPAILHSPIPPILLPRAGAQQPLRLARGEADTLAYAYTGCFPVTSSDRALALARQRGGMDPTVPFRDCPLLQAAAPAPGHLKLKGNKRPRVFLNRLLDLPIPAQALLFSLFSALVAAHACEMKARGEMDTGIVSLAGGNGSTLTQQAPPIRLTRGAGALVGEMQEGSASASASSASASASSASASSINNDLTGATPSATSAAATALAAAAAIRTEYCCYLLDRGMAFNTAQDFFLKHHPYAAVAEDLARKKLGMESLAGASERLAKAEAEAAEARAGAGGATRADRSGPSADRQ